MATLVTDQKTIKDVFLSPKTHFVIPDFQRPYSWGEKECGKLWDDLFEFAYPDNCPNALIDDSEYFLGPIVMYKNEDNLDVIDGQQRLTTLILLLRVFYLHFEQMVVNDRATQNIRNSLEACIWHLNADDLPIKSKPKLTSEVITDDSRAELMEIIKTGQAPATMTSVYANNYRFFCQKVEWLKTVTPNFTYFVKVVLNNCLLLPIEANSLDYALRIFSTLNDRGKPLSDSDIFKSELYKYYASIGKKDEFVTRWAELDQLCNKIFHPPQITPMDELFSRYMYYERAKQGIDSSSTEALRSFYEKNHYALLHCDKTFDNLIDLAHFWKDVYAQNDERFSEDAQKLLHTLYYGPNSIYTYYVSVYYLTNRDENGHLDDAAFCDFLRKAIGFIFAYNFIGNGLNSLRGPISKEMKKVVNGITPDYKDYPIAIDVLRRAMRDFSFRNSRPITKSMLVWWMYFQDPKMECLPQEIPLDIEHIYSKELYNKVGGILPKNLESLGNKAILEKRINISASDCRLADKLKYYNGFTTKSGKVKRGTMNTELLTRFDSQAADLTDKDIEDRQELIIESFIDYLVECNIL